MKISKEVWIDQQVKWNMFTRRELCKYNRYRGHAYMVCTSPHAHLLFEIVEAEFLGKSHEHTTLLAVCHSKLQAVEQVRLLVDAIYNQQTKTYTQL